MKHLFIGLTLSSLTMSAVATDLSLTFVENLAAEAVSNNGVVVGTTESNVIADTVAAKWSVVNGVEIINESAPDSIATDISTDGLTITFNAPDGQIDNPDNRGAFVFGPFGISTIALNTFPNGDFAPNGYEVEGISANNVAIGNYQDSFAAPVTPFIWTSEGIELNSDREGISYRAISANGQAILGQTGVREGEVFVFTGETSQQIPSMVQAKDLSADGLTVVGLSDATFHAPVGYVWSQDQGGIEIPGFVPTGVSGNGQTVVGITRIQVGNEINNAAAVWDQTNGVRLLTDILAARGIDTTGFESNSRMDAVSDNGLYYVGHTDNGNPDSNVTSFVVELTPVCTGTL